MTGQKLLTTEELASRWNVRPQTIAVRRCKGTLGVEAVIMPGSRRIYYDLRDVEAYEDKHKSTEVKKHP